MHRTHVKVLEDVLDANETIARAIAIREAQACAYHVLRELVG